MITVRKLSHATVYNAMLETFVHEVTNKRSRRSEQPFIAGFGSVSLICSSIFVQLNYFLARKAALEQYQSYQPVRKDVSVSARRMEKFIGWLAGAIPGADGMREKVHH